MCKYVEVNAKVECLPAHTKEYMQQLNAIHTGFITAILYI